MPEFNGPLTHSSDSAKLLELALHQTRGIGLFDTVAERNSLSSANRSSPYLAYMCNDDKLYVYDGPRESVVGLADKLQSVGNSDWTNTNNWKAVGTSSGGIDNVVEDLSPELGGDLDVGEFSFVSSNNEDISLTPNGTGSIALDAVVKFKRFNTTDPADIPSPAAGALYADNSNRLYFGVT